MSAAADIADAIIAADKAFAVYTATLAEGTPEFAELREAIEDLMAEAAGSQYMSLAEARAFRS